MSVFRIYTEKKPQFAAEAQSVLSDLRTALQLDVLGVRILNRYDADHISEAEFKAAVPTVFSEPAVDLVYDRLPMLSNQDHIFAVEYLPGQFDQRADSCEQCIQILNGGERCRVRNARVYIVTGALSDAEFDKLKSYLINPVESREASLDAVDTLDTNYALPETVETLDGFTALDENGRREFLKNYGLAMDYDDITFCQAYFRDEEHRDPTITEIRMIDTYWSDHCRHTTFLTTIDGAEISDPAIKETYDEYLEIKKALGRGEKPVTLMDMATMAMRKLKADGKIPALDESEEINACSVKIKVQTDSGEEDWILMFKNETHNHPTEIEPFGGAATCLGGAIRDPLSGRAYVYQAMRVTGAGDIWKPVSETMHGKLPQRMISRKAAAGYSSYGNQIGLATTHVREIFHEGYTAKRMEVGAVVGAVPAAQVVRERPVPGDVILLLGGRTGRDGIGGATGSSKGHTDASLTTCGSEVQKGNPPEERKIQRLFRRADVSHMIKKSNDFGAGGVSVAIGELADGLEIHLDRVPTKYSGLNAMELSISESQERMAVVIAAADRVRFEACCAEENIEVTYVADVTDTGRMRILDGTECVADLPRSFIDSAGARHYAKAAVLPVEDRDPFRIPVEGATPEARMKHLLSQPNVLSQKGLIEMFDSTIGRSTVLMPYGGRWQDTESQVSVQ